MVNTVIPFGHPILRTATEIISNLKDPEVVRTVTNLLEAIRSTNAIGLSAPHIGSRQRILAIDLNAEKENAKPALLVMINPELTWVANDVESGWEGSVSLPGIRGFVQRSVHIKVRYSDAKTQTSKDIEFRGLLARIFQHEFDQLDGVFFLDKATKQEHLPG